MGAFTKGSVVLVPFPFSDLSRSKLRPAVILADVSSNDLILCQVTSNPYSDRLSIEITQDSFLDGGSLQRTSYARPGKLFTADNQLIVSKCGLLNKETLIKIIKTVIDIFEMK